jgi:hypothetical protein
LFLADKMNLSAAERRLKPEVRQLLDEVLKVSVYKIEYNQSCHCFKTLGLQLIFPIHVHSFREMLMGLRSTLR